MMSDGRVLLPAVLVSVPSIGSPYNSMFPFLGYQLNAFKILGNHAQGVALSGARLAIPCTIVMPEGTPEIKVRNVSRLGAKVVLHGEDFDAAKAECARLGAFHGLTFVPPYDDPLVIAGQGTIGLEILKQLPNSDQLNIIFAAVGGGGLVAGISEYVKRIGSPHTQVIGVETVDGDAMAKSLEKGERVTLREAGLFSDGTAVKIVGIEPFRICKELLDGIVKVDNDEICAAIKDIFEGIHFLIVCFCVYSLPSRISFCHRARRSAGVGRVKTIYHSEQPDWRSKEVCCSRQWR